MLALLFIVVFDIKFKVYVRCFMMTLVVECVCLCVCLCMYMLLCRLRLKKKKMTQGWVIYGGMRHAEPQREMFPRSYSA